VLVPQSVARSMERRVIILAIGVSIVSVLPVYSVGALAGEILPRLGVREGWLGGAIATYYMAATVASVVGNRVVTRLGWLRSLVTTVALVIVMCMMIVVGPSSPGLLLAALAVTGAAHGSSHPAANHAIVHHVEERRRGFAFGLKQAAVPGATLAAGVALPLIVVPFGWKAMFGTLALLGLLVSAASIGLGGRGARSDRAAGLDAPARSELDRPVLALLVVGSALGAAASVSMGTFFVLHALEKGFTAAAAGLLLASGGIANVIVRVVLGWDADRRANGHIRRVGFMMITGGIGVVALTLARPLPLFAVSTVLAFGIGWGYNGLLHHGSMRIYGHVAARVTGILQAAQFSGAVVGPLVVGLVVQRFSYVVAWMGMAALLVVGGLFMLRFRSAFLAAASDVPDAVR
jgi:MFS family permease